MKWKHLVAVGLWLMFFPTLTLYISWLRVAGFTSVTQALLYPMNFVGFLMWVIGCSIILGYLTGYDVGDDK